MRDGGYYDRDGLELHAGDFVKAGTSTGDLFRIRNFRDPADAVIENVLPGDRLGTSTLPCRQLEKQINNPVGAPWWWEGDYDPAEDQPIPGTLQPCGCYLRRADTEAVLCEQHLIEVNSQ